MDACWIWSCDSDCYDKWCNVQFELIWSSKFPHNYIAMKCVQIEYLTLLNLLIFNAMESCLSWLWVYMKSWNMNVQCFDTSTFTNLLFKAMGSYLCLAVYMTQWIMKSAVWAYFDNSINFFKAMENINVCSLDIWFLHENMKRHVIRWIQAGLIGHKWSKYYKQRIYILNY